MWMHIFQGGRFSKVSAALQLLFLHWNASSQAWNERPNVFKPGPVWPAVSASLYYGPRFDRVKHHSGCPTQMELVRKWNMLLPGGDELSLCKKRPERETRKPTKKHISIQVQHRNHFETIAVWSTAAPWAGKAERNSHLCTLKQTGNYFLTRQRHRLLFDKDDKSSIFMHTASSFRGPWEKLSVPVFQFNFASSVSWQEVSSSS